MASSTRLWDGFGRADTAAGTLGTAPTGQAWALTGAGFGSAKITGQRYVSGTPGTSQNVYAFATMDEPITSMYGEAVFATGAVQQLGGLIVSRYPDVGFLTDLIHVVFDHDSWLITLYQGGVVIATLGSGVHTATRDGSTPYVFKYTIGDDAIVWTPPDGIRHVFAHPAIAAIRGRTAVFQIFDNATTVGRTSFEAVEAGTLPVALNRRAVGTPLNRIVLSRPGWHDPHPIAVSNLVVTASVEQPGGLSCFVPVAALNRLGLDDVIGLDWFYRHPTQGIFAGRIVDEPSTIDDQTVELAGVDGRGWVMGRRTPVLYRVDTAHAGALARRAMGDATTTDPLPFTELLIDETGRPLEAEWRGDDTYDVLAALANQSGQEWDVVVDDARNIAFVWGRLGEDKRDRVLIREGAHVTGGRVDRSLTTVVNDVAGVAADESYEKSSYTQGERADSIARFGRRQSPVRRYEGVVTESTIRAKVRADLDREASGFYLPTITLPALHPVCHDIRHGDTIRYWSSSKNRELDFRVMSRTVRDGTILELAGEAVEVRIPPRHRPFTPDMLGGLWAWFDADDASTVSVVDGLVNAWHDRTANGFAVWGGFNLAFRPTYQPGAFNGRAVVRFDGVDDRLSSDDDSAATTLDLSHTDVVSVFAVAKRTVAGATSALATFGVLGTEVGSWELKVPGTSDRFQAGLNGNVGLASFRPTPVVSTTAFHVFSAVLDMGLAANEALAWLDGDGTGIVFGVDNTGNFAAALPLMIGTRGSLEEWPGDIAEILIYDRALSTTHRQAVEGYLQKKWGL